MIDDRSSSVSLPEVPLLGVLPGTGGLTRVIDKRRVRRDLADVFCSSTEGVRAERAKDWGLVDEIAKPQGFDAVEKKLVNELIQSSIRPDDAAGIALKPIVRKVSDNGMHYETLEVDINRSTRVATITLNAPVASLASELGEIHKEGSNWWPLKFARELDDAILLLRTNELDIGTWVFRSQGRVEDVLNMDRILDANKRDWFVRETLGFIRRTLARLDVSSRTMFTLIEQGSCFAGTLLEVALASDRTFMLSESEDGELPFIAMSEMNFGTYPMINHLSRLQTRFYGADDTLKHLSKRVDTPISPDEAMSEGLVTFAPDDIDWDDEVRIAIEERASLSPDALTGMEASLRFSGPETMETRIFGRLSAWQNWIFIRPNAVGEEGALKVFGSGSKPSFNWQRI
jgi:benzoyl-CoA-dihydrodiol lyase